MYSRDTLYVTTSVTSTGDRSGLISAVSSTNLSHKLGTSRSMPVPPLGLRHHSQGQNEVAAVRLQKGSLGCS
jgi:hypothetical protein